MNFIAYLSLEQQNEIIFRLYLSVNATVGLKKENIVLKIVAKTFGPLIHCVLSRLYLVRIFLSVGWII
jgi:hypothetical protein